MMREQDWLELLRLVGKINRSLDLREVLHAILEETREVTDSEAGAVFLMDETQEALQFYTVSGGAGATLQEYRIPLEKGIAGYVARTGEAVILNDPHRDPRYLRDLEDRTGYITRNLMAIPLEHKGERIGVAEVLNHRKGPYTSRDLEIFQALGEMAAVAIQNARLYADLERLFRESLRALVAAIDARDPYTAGHSERVSRYAVWMGETLGLSREEQKQLELAALFHDIGKISIPDAVLLKAGRLSEEEYRLIQSHPERGVEILRHIRQFEPILPAVRHHHERWDGQGYPDGLAGEAIPLFARIIAYVDTYDALTTDRPYRKGFPPRRALEILEENAGTQLDPGLFGAFRAALPRMVQAGDA